MSILAKLSSKTNGGIFPLQSVEASARRKLIYAISEVPAERVEAVRVIPSAV